MPATWNSATVRATRLLMKNISRSRITWGGCGKCRREKNRKNRGSGAERRKDKVEETLMVLIVEGTNGQEENDRTFFLQHSKKTRTLPLLP